MLLWLTYIYLFDAEVDYHPECICSECCISACAKCDIKVCYKIEQNCCTYTKSLDVYDECIRH